jgi:transposase
MSSSEGHCRTQWRLWPDRLDDAVPAEKPVRVMAAEVASLELARLGCARAHAAFTGSPAYAPREVLTRSISGDLHRSRASRRRARATHRHVELRWLLRKLRPDFKPLADVRKQHPKALHALCREVVLLGRQVARFGAERLASEGRKCQAVNTTHTPLTPATREQALQAIDAQVEQSWRDLDPSAREESRGQQPTREALQEQRARRTERQPRSRGFVQELTARGAPQRSRTAPESRSRPKSPTVAVGDNVQRAVESQPKRRVAQAGAPRRGRGRS